MTPYSSLSEKCQLTLDHVVTVGKPAEPFRQSVSICEGDSYTIGDSTYRIAGLYLTPIKRGTLLCDSLVQNNACIRLIHQLTIYDRWGEVVFSGQDKLAGDVVLGWDGRYRGLECNAGVYSYQVKIELMNGQIVHYRGRVVLIR